jgi:hypothetical protein
VTLASIAAARYSGPGESNAGATTDISLDGSYNEKVPRKVPRKYSTHFHTFPLREVLRKCCSRTQGKTMPLQTRARTVYAMISTVLEKFASLNLIRPKQGKTIG